MISTALKCQSNNQIKITPNENHTKYIYTVIILMCAALFLTSMIFMQKSIDHLNQDTRGVYKTTFGFIGDYEIRAEIIKNDIWYVGYCLANTSSHGDCTYSYYKSKKEDKTYYYTDLYCGSNRTAISLNGYISTNVHKCQIDDFNDTTNKHVWKIVLIVSSIIFAIFVILIMIILIDSIIVVSQFATRR